MAALQELAFLSEEDYLAGELLSPIKHEYIDGRVYAMSGGTANHSGVSANFIGTMRSKLSKKGCRTFTGDLSVRVERRGGVKFYYPDASVVCTPISGTDQFTTEPVVILEVLSPSTRRNDESSKREDYLTFPSLKVYLLAEANKPQVTIYRRVGDRFEIEIHQGRDSVIPLPEIEMNLSLEDLYRDVE